MSAATPARRERFIYASHENRKHIAKLLHKHIHNRYAITSACFHTISYMDSVLYSETTRNAIRDALSNTSEDAPLHAWLDTANQTRQNLYHFCLKGSNSIPLLLYYLKNKYDAGHTLLPKSYESDWDTTILINPTLAPRQFMAIFETLVPILQRALVVASHMLHDSPGFLLDLPTAIVFANEYIQVASDYEAYRKYPIMFKDEKETHLKIHDASAADPGVAEFVKGLGMAGKGLFVTSNRDGGIAPANRGRVPPKFYLGRIMASVVASRDAWLPVELFDISMNYQNDDLRFSWESYSEYPLYLPVYGINFRVLSPTGMYADLVKCLYDADRSNNVTRKNKAPARAARIQEILDSMIVPYGTNAVIRANFARHATSPTLVGNIVRRLNTTRRRDRNDWQSYYSATAPERAPAAAAVEVEEL